MATSEVKAFKKQVAAWLRSIPGMSDVIGAGDSARVYYGWPISRLFPMVTFTLHRTPAAGYGFSAWGGTCNVALHAKNIDDLDVLEDLIENWLQDEDNHVLVALSLQDQVSCNFFQASESGVGPEEYTPDQTGEGYEIVTRSLPFDFLFVAAPANQP